MIAQCPVLHQQTAHEQQRLLARPMGFDDFLEVEPRMGRIVAAEVFAQARKPAYILQVDFGPALGLRKSSAQIGGPIQSEYRPWVFTMPMAL